MKMSVIGCFVEEVMCMFGGCWWLLLVLYLFDGLCCFSDLWCDMLGILQCMLMFDLCVLKDVGFVW